MSSAHLAFLRRCGRRGRGHAAGPAPILRLLQRSGRGGTARRPRRGRRGASGGSGSETDAGSTTSDTSNEALWALVIIGGVLIIGLIVWGASRSGAKSGAREQAQEDAYGSGTGEEAPPPPSAEGPPG